MIDLFIPVLGRPGNVQPLVESIEVNTTVPHRVVFIVSAADKDEISAIQRIDGTLLRCNQDGWAAKLNLATKLSKAEFFFLGADDIRFHRDWDVNAIRRFEETRKPVVGTNDLANPVVMKGLHATHLLVHRSYLLLGTADDPDKLLHDGYHHQWVDNEFIETAKWRDAWTFAADSHVEHLHPMWRTAQMDATYQRGLDHRKAQEDRRLWQKRRHLWR